MGPGTRWAHALVAVLALAVGSCSSATPSSAARSPSSPSPASSVAPHATIDPASLAGRIVFSSEDDVFTIRADGTGLRRLTSAAGPEFDPSWSPDGTRIAYRDSRGGVNSNDEIYVMWADGSRKRNVTHDPGNDWGPDWSPDGRWIAFNSDRGGLPQLYVMRPDGSAVRRVTEREAEYPSWSPDGARIAFMSMEPGASGSNPEYEIYAVGTDGTGLRRFTRSEGEDGWPAWSPDGRTIAFASPRSGRDSGDIGPYFEVWLMDADGSDQRRLAGAFGQYPAWSPDGRRVLLAPTMSVVDADGSRLTALPYDGVTPELLLPDWVGD